MYHFEGIFEFKSFSDGSFVEIPLLIKIVGKQCGVKGLRKCRNEILILANPVMDFKEFAFQGRNMFFSEYILGKIPYQPLQ